MQEALDNIVLMPTISQISNLSCIETDEKWIKRTMQGDDQTIRADVDFYGGKKTKSKRKTRKGKKKGKSKKTKKRTYRKRK